MKRILIFYEQICQSSDTISCDNDENFNIVKTSNYIDDQSSVELLINPGSTTIKWNNDFTAQYIKGGWQLVITAYMTNTPGASNTKNRMFGYCGYLGGSANPYCSDNMDFGEDYNKQIWGTEKPDSHGCTCMNYCWQ